jgi:hypothetical protein
MWVLECISCINHHDRVETRDSACIHTQPLEIYVFIHLLYRKFVIIFFMENWLPVGHWTVLSCET